MFPAIDLQDTRVPVSYEPGLKVSGDYANIVSTAVDIPVPGPNRTMEILAPDFRRLPSFLTHRLREFGYKEQGSDHRFDQFLGVPFECRNAIIRNYLVHNLSNRQNLVLMLRLPIKELERMESLWRSIEDCLLFSSPENFSKGLDGPVRRIFDWYVGAYVHSGFEFSLKTWKQFCSYVKQKALLAVDCEPVKPIGFPWYDTNSDSMRPTGIVWLDRAIARGLKSKSEGTRLMHLISSRGAPCPTFEMKVKSLLKHQSTMRSVPQPEPYESLIGTFRAGLEIGKRAAKNLGDRNLLSTEHVSLTNSSCFENPRSMGGRASFARERLFEFANTDIQEDTSMKLVLGHVIKLVKGKKMWQCFTPVSPLNEGEDQESSVFGEIFSTEGILPKRCGFNQNLGYLLLQSSFEYGIAKGNFSRDYVMGETLIEKKAVALGEPGGKSRSLTIGEWHETILLQPLGHILVESLASLPECSAGLSKGEPLWKFLQDVEGRIRKGNISGLFADVCWLKSSDLDKATDHTNREVAKYLLCGYLAGLGKNYTNNFLIFSVDLLVGPRKVTWLLD